MNRKIGMYSSIINAAAVACFALSMPFMFNFGSYLSSIFIALSFIPMLCAFCIYADKGRKLAGYTAIAFAAVYATIILLVYFAQLTTVRLESLSQQAAAILDYQNFGLYFNYDLLGYAMMALGTFFAGLSITPKSTAEKWLKALLMIHGVFFISCLIMPLLGVFSADMQGAYWIGTALLEFWCIYFIPIGILSFFYFKKQSE